jgi:exodeoxyribonuclease VII small subunit
MKENNIREIEEIAMSDNIPDEKKISFEDALAQLEKIVEDVEQEKISLELSIDKYAQGMKLIKYCRAILEQAEKQIELISEAGKKRPTNPSAS